jgi:hypothetical protein
MVNDVMAVYAGVDVAAILQPCEEIDRGPWSIPPSDGLKLLDQAIQGSVRAGCLRLLIKLVQVVSVGRSKGDRVGMDVRVAA